MKCLFEIKDGKAQITDHVRTIWFYNDIIEKYGEKIALKIFIVYHYMADMSQDNPHANVNEIEKLETVVRGVCPEIVLEVDWNDELIQEGIEFTRKLYETPAYRKYLAVKYLADKATNAIHYSYVDTSKESGNSGELKKALELFDALNEQAKKAYTEYLEEQGSIRVRGQGLQSSNNRKSNLPKDLD